MYANLCPSVKPQMGRCKYDHCNQHVGKGMCTSFDDDQPCSKGATSYVLRMRKYGPGNTLP